ncbi:MAG: monovalent cation:H+ antiporter-2, family [Burkholderiales bacterium]
MHAAAFIQDLAVIMLIAGIVTVLFHRLKQPVVLGYIVAGVIIGPHTPPFKLIQDEHTIQILAELGVVFLMFSLGLEFSLKKLSRVGATAFVAALAEITFMIWIGYEIGSFFGWKPMDSLFLGAMLAISSTTIIVKALEELGMKREKFAQLIFGILIVEDILAIGLMALLSGIAMTGEVDAASVFATVGKLSLFMIVALVLGLLVVPRLLVYVAQFKSNEMMLITVLGLCFGFCLLVVKLEYSIALGAFLIGAIMAEARPLHWIERLVEPVRNMFSAIFFVAIGLLFDPTVLVDYALPIAVITVAVVLGKVLTCGLGTFLAGHDGRTSMRVGMGVSQIGEFSFIIATLGLTLKVTSEFLYPIVVAVSAITTLLTPYLIKAADPLSARLATSMPNRMANFFGRYSVWLQSIQLEGDRAVIANIILRISLQILVNCALVAGVFLAGAYLIGGRNIVTSITDEQIQRTIVWGAALVISLPFLIATYRKLEALSMLLGELRMAPSVAGRYKAGMRHMVFRLIPALSIAGIMLLISVLSASILPPAEWLAAVLIGAAILAGLLWKPFVKLHARLQIALFKTLEEDKSEH